MHPYISTFWLLLNYSSFFLYVFQLEFKPDELPPAYNEQSISMYPITPPPPRPDMVQPQAQ